MKAIEKMTIKGIRMKTIECIVAAVVGAGALLMWRRPDTTIICNG